MIFGPDQDGCQYAIRRSWIKTLFTKVELESLKEIFLLDQS